MLKYAKYYVLRLSPFLKSAGFARGLSEILQEPINLQVLLR